MKKGLTLFGLFIIAIACKKDKKVCEKWHVMEWCENITTKSPCSQPTDFTTEICGENLYVGKTIIVRRDSYNEYKRRLIYKQE